MASQFLASELEFTTVPRRPSQDELSVSVDWEKAIKVGTLTQATATYKLADVEKKKYEGSTHGMAIRLKGLNQTWSTKEIVDLAKEIWMLQPPFGRNALQSDKTADSFSVVVESDDSEVVGQFDAQATAALENWHALIKGRIVPVVSKEEGKRTARARVFVDFGSDVKFRESFDIDNCTIQNLDFEIRVFHLKQRQPRGITVGDAREYLNRYGGVHIYDAGFRLPYYGSREADWLELEFDHSHRLSKSKLLPEHLQQPDGMNFLPSNSRVYGVVNVNTSTERLTSESPDCLKMSVTRDRLIDNRAFLDLKHIVRWSIDYYATLEAKRSIEEVEARRPREPASAKLLRVEDVLEKYQPDIPPELHKTLTREIADAVKAGKGEEDFRQQQVGLLGALATAGMTALAFEHELNREMQSLKSISGRLTLMSRKGKPSEIATIATDLAKWMDRIKATRAVFSWLLSPENRELGTCYKAKALLDDVRTQLSIFTKHVEVDTSAIPGDLRLPSASYAEWSAVFQNVIINAINATSDSDERRIVAVYRKRRSRDEILIEDTGCGVDLDDSEVLFEPLVRKLEMSPDRRSMGLGGTGLGLTIVRMITENAGCSVDFVRPDTGFNTALRLSWKT